MIWKSIRKRSIRLRVQQFLFKAIHNTPMIGEKWANIPGYEQRGQCATCRTAENMNHIILTCNAQPVSQIWRLARQLWPHKNLRWPEITLGTALGCACITAQEEPQYARDGSEWTTYDQRGATRLLQIIISEATHLIWVLRCERVIQEKTHTEEETTTRWYKAINRRLTNDKITAMIIKRKKPFTQLVESTWEKILKKNSNLPIKWIYQHEVLVGSNAIRTLAQEGRRP
jgi:hypothetical protein